MNLKDVNVIEHNGRYLMEIGKNLASFAFLYDKDPNGLIWVVNGKWHIEIKYSFFRRVEEAQKEPI